LWRRVLPTRTTYCIQWIDDRGRRRTEAAGTDKALANQMRKDREYQLNRQKMVDTVSVRLKDFREEHERLMTGRLSPQTIKMHIRSLKLFEEAIGNKMLDAITVSDVEEFVACRLKSRAEHRKTTCSVATVNRDLRHLRGILETAVARKRMRSNPVSLVPKLRESERTIRTLSPDEIKSLRNACPNAQWRCFLILAAGCGLRRGEITWLRWEDVDLENGIVTIRCTDDHSTKSRRNRIMALHPAWVSELRSLRGLQRDGFVFTTSTGSRWVNNLNRQFDAIVARAGIAHCTMHDLRRTFGTTLANSKVNQAIVKEMMGHADMATTTTHYTRVLSESVRAAVAQLPYADDLVGRISARA